MTLFLHLYKKDMHALKFTNTVTGSGQMHWTTPSLWNYFQSHQRYIDCISRINIEICLTGIAAYCCIDRHLEFIGISGKRDLSPLYAVVYTNVTANASIKMLNTVQVQQNNVWSVCPWQCLRFPHLNKNLQKKKVTYSSIPNQCGWETQ